MEKVKVFVGFGLGAILILLCWLVVQGVFFLEEATNTVKKINKIIDTNQAAITTTVDKAAKTVEDLSSLASKGKEFTEIVATTDRAKEIANYLDILNFNSQLAQNDIREAINQSKQTSIMLSEQAKPILVSTNQLVLEGKATVEEFRHQIKQNGDEVKLLLEQGRTLIAKSEVELIATLSNINKTANGLQILVNDPKLKNTIQSADLTLQNVQVITKELADLSTYLIEPVVRPRRATGIKRFGQIVLKVFRVLNGTGQVLFLIDRIGG